MKKLVMTFALALGLAACGSAGANNVSACKSLSSKIGCGSTANPLPASVCDGYANTACDISAYFTCLEGAYVCTNGMYDTAKLATVGACSSKATCQ